MSSLVAHDLSTIILTIRGQRVILDTDLAKIYGVPTFRFNEAVKRNKERFPEDFMFQLTSAEFTALRSQFAMSKTGRGGRRTRPYAFTEHGALMAANLLNSSLAILMSVEVVRAFVRLRQLTLSVAEFARKVNAMESKYDSQFKIVFDAIRQLMTPPDPPRKKIGFNND